MTKTSPHRCIARFLAAGAGVAAASYAGYAAYAWALYGNPCRPKSGEHANALLDRFMPDYEVVERHRIHVDAPAEVAYEAACNMDLTSSAIIRAIFRIREAILGARVKETAYPRGVVAQTKAMGWGVLAEIPGREIVMGAVTQPWVSDIVFRAIPPEEFAAFNDPGYVKIVWTIRAGPDGEYRSIHSTETRATTTDAVARAKFRRYWAAFSAGIVLIRKIGVRLAKRDAERGLERR